MSKNDGGPAFPDPTFVHSGMSLRDWFAGMALQGALAAWDDYDRKMFKPVPYSQRMEIFANDAYAMADAMLAEREKKD